ncbi:sulfotransferase family protein [Actinomadura xylanilytica]|uniref:sulfotransferase family protein n=1 Tax=Actinomadura xylanilytica TaxID=887459 RepID=UPI00255B1F6B|nr:sulfotransferase [Actinomadura xylanilytica]MDL4774768.1 sulfotransferase [Actinomadura xylanilytica]
MVSTGGISTEQSNLNTATMILTARRVAGDNETELFNLEALEQLVRSLDGEARLTSAGRVRAQRSLVRSLVEQLETSHRIAERPETTNRPLRPIIITGMLRTGTTFLQHLLAQHPQLRAPALWEMMAPARRDPPDELISQCAAYIAEYDRIAPKFKHIHPLRVDFPEECHRLTGNTFCDPIFALRYHVPGYTKWLDRQSMAPIYRYHRTQLQVLLDRIPGDHVLLKGPSHLWYLDDLAAVYPDALVVRMHRSPAVAVPSVCSLTSVVRRAGADPVDDHEIGRYWLERVTPMLEGLRRGAGPFDRSPLDIRYADLVADPMAVVAEICATAGLSLTGAARRRMNGYLSAGHSQGRHAYRAEQFGLRSGQLADRFSDYLDEFAIPHEA